ncbi:MAG: sugar phosphate isomerase/epimerase [Clostridia bacterium]|nr:sugar phosphate isomerase/epimerase [Clostridia bacterium]
MIFGNAAWGLRETPLEKQFEITAGMGLKAIEIGIANAPMDIALNATDAELTDILKLSEEYGVKMLAAATGNDFTTGTEDIEKIKRVIDICKKLKIDNLRIFAGFTPLDKVTDEIFDTMINSLTSVCNYAKEKEVVPVIETHGAVDGYDDGVVHTASTTTDIKTLKKIMNLLPDNAKLCFDPSNLYAVGVKNPEIFFEEFKEKVAYAHFKDFKKLPSGHLKPSYCGDGDIDWNKILNTMKNFSGAALFEYENVEDVEDGLMKCYNYIKRLQNAIAMRNAECRMRNYGD